MMENKRFWEIVFKMERVRTEVQREKHLLDLGLESSVAETFLRMFLNVGIQSIAPS